MTLGEYRDYIRKAQGGRSYRTLKTLLRIFFYYERDGKQLNSNAPKNAKGQYS